MANNRLGKLDDVIHKKLFFKKINVSIGLELLHST